MYQSSICRFLLMSLLFISCSNAEVNNSYIDLDNPDEVSIWDFADSVKIVQLETSQECLLNSVSKIMYHDGMIFISDTRQKKVFKFDTSGKYVCQIGMYGRGPEEHLYFEDFYLDKYNNQVIIQEPWGKMVCYNFDGSFREKVVLPDEIMAYNTVYALNKDTFLFNSAGSDYNIVYYSRSKDSLINKLYPVEEERPYLLINKKEIYEFEGSLYSYMPLDNRILNISGSDDCKLTFEVDFGKDNFKDTKVEALIKYTTDNSKELAKNRKSVFDLLNMDMGIRYFLSYVNESERYRILQYAFRDDYWTAIYDKQSNEYVSFKQTKESVRLLGAQIYDNKLFLVSGRSIRLHGKEPIPLSIVPATSLSGRNKELVESYNPEEDNPYLVIYYLKK